LKKKEAHLNLGEGPSVTVVDADLITPKKVLQWIEETADKFDIPYQPDVGTAGSTDAAICRYSLSSKQNIVRLANVLPDNTTLML
jgi:putative aminopeptidase FrvX